MFGGVLCVLAGMLWRRSRLASSLLLGGIVGVMLICYGAFVRDGGIDYTLTIDRPANQFMVQETYPKTGEAVASSETYALDQVLRTDLEPSTGKGGNGGAILTTLRDGTEINPLGSSNREEPNQMLILDTIQRYTGQPVR